MPRILSRLPLLLLAGLAGCELGERLAAPASGLAASRFGAPDIVVAPGTSIQAAVEAAGADAVIHLEPGVYAEAVTITAPGVKIVGLTDAAGNGAIITNPGGIANGITVRNTAMDFALVNVTVRNFDRNGVLLIGVNGFLLSGVTVQDNGAYGLFPVRSSNGVIERSVASGHGDAGLYVGQGRGVTMRGNVVFGNVVGIEASNSSEIKLLGNRAYDNTNGILVVLLPGRQIKTAADILVSGNEVTGNNRPNFAAPGDLVAAVPAGTGILLVGADRVTVEENRVSGHDFIGMGVGSSLILALLSGTPPEQFGDIEPNPDGVRVRNNAVTGNGTASPIPFLPPVDLLWDGSGLGNCWSGNTFGTSAPASLPACP
jgi:parallel beta-helix repeat protein